MHVNAGNLWADLVTILILVALEGLLSGDNALVLAVIVRPLPPEQRRKALHYGIVGAFVLRIIATSLAVVLTKLKWVALFGGIYLLYLPIKHFTQHPDENNPAKDATLAGANFLGLSLFWAVVIKADLIDLVFAVDSILAAVAVTKVWWVVVTGGLLGILMMRLLTLQVLALVERYPKLIDGAYVIIFWVGTKLVWEYLHGIGVVPFEIKEWVSICVVLFLFAASFVHARMHHKISPGLANAVSEAEELFGGTQGLFLPRLKEEAAPPATAEDGAGSEPADDELLSPDLDAPDVSSRRA